MPEEVKRRLLVELVRRLVHDDGRVDVVVDPVRSALLVEHQVPVGPGHDPVPKGLDDVVAVVLAALPASEIDFGDLSLRVFPGRDENASLKRGLRVQYLLVFCSINLNILILLILKQVHNDSLKL